MLVQTYQPGTNSRWIFYGILGTLSAPVGLLVGWLVGFLWMKKWGPKIRDLFPSWNARTSAWCLFPQGIFFVLNIEIPIKRQHQHPNNNCKQTFSSEYTQSLEVDLVYKVFLFGLSFFVCFWDKVFLWTSPDCPGTDLEQLRLALNLQRLAFLCFPSTGIKGAPPPPNYKGFFF